VEGSHRKYAKSDCYFGQRLRKAAVIENAQKVFVFLFGQRLRKAAIIENAQK
jgi:hypothetical protein